MELDKMKDNWNSWEESLKRKEILDERMIRKMIEGKRNQAIDKLINAEIWSGIWACISIICCTIVWSGPVGKKHMQDWFLWVNLLVLFFMVLYVWRGLRSLHRMDAIKKNMKELALSIHRYKRSSQTELLFTPFLGIMYAVLFISSLKAFSDIAYYFILIFVAIGLLFAVLLSWIIYRRFTLKNIQEIQESIEEWEEVEKD